MDLKKINLEYYQSELKLENLRSSPIEQLQNWFKDAIMANVSYPNAATLCTIDHYGFPQARIILTKEINDQGIKLFSNYESAKGLEISQSNKIGLNIFWKELDRQVRITGRISKTSSTESEIYFRSRPRASQISAIASNQSQITTKEELVARVNELNAKYPNTEDIPMPKNWGGYLITPITYEFWQGRPNRLHDRFKYTNSGVSWNIVQLAP